MVTITNTHAAGCCCRLCAPDHPACHACPRPALGTCPADDPAAWAEVYPHGDQDLIAWVDDLTSQVVDQDDTFPLYSQAPIASHSILAGDDIPF